MYLPRLNGLLLGLVVALCMSSPAKHVQAGTIADEVSTNPDFSTLLALVQAVDNAGLEGEANLQEALAAADPELTVFAPSNDAISKALADLDITQDDLLADPANLARILQFHVAPQKIMAADILDDGEIATLLGMPLMTMVADGNVMVNSIKVVTADVAADNGVIHVIEGVLMPPGEGEESADGMLELPTDGADDAVTAGEDAAAAGPSSDGDTIAKLAMADDQFSNLMAAITALDAIAPEGEAKLAEALDDASSTLTVFAPNNDAIDATLADKEMSLEDFLALDNLLQIIQYHVVPQTALAADLSDGQMLETLDPDGGKIKVTVNDDGVSLNGGQAKVVNADIQASNGVIHVIDRVMIPGEAAAGDTAGGEADAGEDGNR